MMTSTSMKRVSIKRQLQQFSVQDKLDAIQRVNEGESKASVARDIGVPESTLRGWCKSEDKLRSSSNDHHMVDENQAVGHVINNDGLTGLCNGALDSLGPSAKRVRSTTEVTAACNSLTTPTAGKEPELDEALWYWLRQQQQHVVGLSEQLCQQPVKSATSASIAAAAAAAVAATTGAMVSNATADLNPSTGWFWRWYKRYGLTSPLTDIGKIKTSSTPAVDTMGALPLLTTNRATPAAAAPATMLPLNRTPAPAHTPTHTPLAPLAHLTAPAPPAHHAIPAHPAPVPISHSFSTAAAPEDPSDDEDDEPPLTAADAVAHGEKFLRWLDCCSDPSITALQILQFRYLLNNVRACVARRAKVSSQRSDKI